MPPREVEVAFNWDGLRLVGSLHLPEGIGPSPAVLMLQGSGPADRESGGFFPEIRDAFVDRGIATYSFDKPGCGLSSGAWRDYGIEGRVDQAIAALRVVGDQAMIDHEQVGVWGHSQGGWIVQQLAGRQQQLAFAIANSAPSIGVRAQILYDLEHAMRDQGLADDAVSEALLFVTALHDAGAAGVDYETVSRRVIEPAQAKTWFEALPTIEGADDWRHLSVLVSEYVEPLESLALVRCPFLAVYGGRDPLLPAWQGAEESGRALEAAETADATVVVFPSGDHRLQDVTSKRFVDGYLDLLGDWTRHRTS